MEENKMNTYYNYNIKKWITESEDGKFSRLATISEIWREDFSLRVYAGLIAYTAFIVFMIFYK